MAKLQPVNESSTYLRVMPRDLFNESNLLKCWGFLVLECMDGIYPELSYDDISGRFIVERDDTVYGFYLSNVSLYINGVPFRPFVPVNSRDKNPFYIESEETEWESLRIIDDNGKLTAEFKNFVKTI